MIEGYDTDGTRVLLNPREVVEVFAGGQDFGFWCNVKMSNGTLHRFKGATAEKVYKALAAA
jgi:hypothetical protein